MAKRKGRKWGKRDRQQSTPRSSHVPVSGADLQSDGSSQVVLFSWQRRSLHSKKQRLKVADRRVPNKDVKTISAVVGTDGYNQPHKAEHAFLSLFQF